jgi:hypothetical protein
MRRLPLTMLGEVRDESRRTVIVGLAALVLVAGGLLWADGPTAPLPPGTQADLLVVDKSAGHLSLYAHGALVRTYPLMQSNVDWPNGMEGGRVRGCDEMRGYWRRP